MLRLLTMICILAAAAGALAVTETQTLTVSNGGQTDFYATLDIPQHDAATKG